MNIVLDEAFEEKSGGEKVAIGMVVCVMGSWKEAFCATWLIRFFLVCF